MCGRIWTLDFSISKKKKKILPLPFRWCLTWIAAPTSWFWTSWTTRRSTASKPKLWSPTRPRAALVTLWNASLHSDHTGWNIHTQIISTPGSVEGLKYVSCSYETSAQRHIFLILPINIKIYKFRPWHEVVKTLRTCVTSVFVWLRLCWTVSLASEREPLCCNKRLQNEKSSISCPITITPEAVREKEGGKMKLLEVKSKRESFSTMTIITSAHPTLFTIFRSVMDV